MENSRKCSYSFKNINRFHIFFVNSEQLNVIICIIHKQRDILCETIKHIVTNLSNISETSFSNKILEQQASYENKTRLTQLQVEILWQTFSH